MSPEGHRPIRNTDPATTLESSPDILEAAPPPPIEPVVLPYYRPPRRRTPAPLAQIDEAFPPEEAPTQPLRDAAEGTFGETLFMEALIGNDDRVRVVDPLLRTNPWRQICALRIHAATGSTYSGTAWFIGPRVLATAGHCVFMKKEKGWVESIDVIPGKHGRVEPFGRVTSRRFATVDGWIDNASRDFDYGVIFLDDPALGTRVGNFEVRADLDTELAAITARISGYPIDKDRAEFQHFHERPMQSVSATRLLYDVDTWGGQSGSPIWRQTEGGPAVAIGIHTTGGFSGNSGTRISEPVLDNLMLWNEAP